MNVRCFFRLCSFGAWRTLEASSIESDGEWVRQRPFERRECRHCGRRQERSKGDEWQGYHIGAEHEQDEEPVNELRRAAEQRRNQTG